MAKRKRRSKESIRLERQEWLGDALLHTWSSRLLYKRYPKLTEGELTQARESLVSGRVLAAAARECGLAQRWGADAMSDSTIAGKMENYFAECYLDDGEEAVNDEMQRILRSALKALDDKIAAGMTLKDPRMALQEITHISGKTPDYTLVKKTGGSHNAYYYMECRAHVAKDKTIIAVGEGKTLRAAERDAAEGCLRLIDKQAGGR